MSDLPVCRACLVMDVVLYPILNLYTQEVYQHLTNLSFESPDGKPQYLCYECRSVMRRCVEFRDKCLRADGVLNQLVSSQMLTAGALSIIDRNLYKLTSNLISTPTEIISTELKYPAPIKTEADLSKDSVQDVAHNIDELDAYTRQKYDEIDEELAANDAIERTKDVMDDLKIDYQSEVSGFEANEEKMISDFEGANDSVSEDDLPLSSISRGPEAASEVGKRKGETTCGKRASFQAPYAKEVTLTAEEQQAEMKKRASSTNYLHSQYKCELCFKGFVDETAFKNHLDKHSESRGAFRCGVCSLRCASARQLRAHEISAHARQYHCLTCAHRSHTAHQAREHERWHRGLGYACALCGAQFRKPTSHLTHMRKKHPSEHVCVRCGDSFVGRRGLVVHNTKSHRDVGPQEDTPESERTCKECNIVFLTVEACKRHTVNSVKHKHDTENSNACSKCAERFPSAAALLAHQRAHGPRRPPPVARLACSYCGVQLAGKSKLHAHVRRVHLGIKYNKNIVCELCGKKCTSNATLRYHQRTHTGERPYACTAPACARRFADSNQLRIHARTHSGERPYSCEVCSRAFRQKPALNRHMRVHTGAKPYGCHYCAKTFSQSNSLKLHIRTVHFKVPSNTKRHKVQIATAEKEMSINV